MDARISSNEKPLPDYYRIAYSLTYYPEQGPLCIELQFTLVCTPNVKHQSETDSLNRLVFACVLPIVLQY